MSMGRSFAILCSSFALVGALVAGCAPDATPKFPHAVLTPAPAKELPAGLKLVDQDGKPFDLASLKGRWVWVYAGFANCPDVCPVALDFMAKEYKQLKHPERVQPLFLSVDPQRDTPAKLKAFVGYYNPAFRGVTGDKASIDALTKTLGAGYVLEKPDAQGSYLVSHSNLVFVLDPEGRYVATYVPGSNPGDFAADFDALPELPAPTKS